MPVMGHIGFTPQFNKKFKIEGQTIKEINKLLNEAKLIEEAGAFSIVLECLSPNAAKLITNKLKIPTIGIGSSLFCDGQILVIDDLIATGGTAEAAAKLIEISGGKVAGFIFVINLFDLPGEKLLKDKSYFVESLIKFPGH